MRVRKSWLLHLLTLRKLTNLGLISVPVLAAKLPYSHICRICVQRVRVDTSAVNRGYARVRSEHTIERRGAAN